MSPEDGWMDTEVPCAECAGGWHPARKCVDDDCPCEGIGEPVGPHVEVRGRPDLCENCGTLWPHPTLDRGCCDACVHRDRRDDDSDGLSF